MSDWDFLYEMKDRGCSEAEIQDAMASGVAPWEWAYIEKQERKAEWEKLKSLRDAGTISREEFKKRKAKMFR
ncbi:MAG: SHOCT domain-containing protein [Candidatus Contendobacter sp.]|nr:SHOCT domain-containing protein [Candidatus Contendobacter sp.]